MGPDTSHIRSAFFHRWSVFSLSLLVLFNKPCLSYITIYPKYIMCIFVHLVIFTLSLLCVCVYPVHIFLRTPPHIHSFVSFLCIFVHLVIFTLSIVYLYTQCIYSYVLHLTSFLCICMYVFVHLVIFNLK